MSTRYYEIDIPIGLRGVFGTSETFAPGTEEYLLGCDNITFIDGVVASDFGEEDYNSVLPISSPILGGFEFNHDQQTPVVVVFTQDGRLLKDDGLGNFSTTLASGLNASKHPVFVAGGKEGAALNRKLFIFTGTNQVKVLSGNGTSVSNISNPPADWSTNYPKSGLIFEGRLCGFGNRNDPHRLYFSTTTDHENFTSSGAFTLSVFPGEGEGLSAAIPVQYGVILFKYPKGVYFLDASDPVTTNWRIYKVSSAVGTASQKSVVDIGGAIFFIDSSGHPYLIQLGGSATTGRGGIVSILNLANRHAIMSFVLRKLDKSIIKDKWFAFYDPRTSEFGFSDTNTTIKIDLLTGEPRFREIRNPKAICAFEILGVNSNVRTIAFGVGGKILKGVLDKYKTPIEFLTSGYDFYKEGIAGKRKIAGELEVRLTFFKGVPQDVDVEVYLDDKLSSRKTIHFSGSGLSIYGTISNPGTGAYFNAGYIYYSGSEYRSIRKTETIKLFGTGRFIRVAVKQKGSYGVSPAGVAVNRLVLRAMVGDERV